jgi:hypothetical protein
MRTIPPAKEARKARLPRRTMFPKLKRRRLRIERAQLPTRLKTEQWVVVEGERGVEPVRRRPLKRRWHLRRRPVVVDNPRPA